MGLPVAGSVDPSNLRQRIQADPAVQRYLLAKKKAAASRAPAPAPKPAAKASTSSKTTKERGTQKLDAPNAVDPNQAINDRFGNDMAWLDPAFQQDPALLGDSQQSQAYADPEAIKAQKAALDQLMGIANGGGATDIERARMANARNEQEGWLRGQREADLQNMAERGMAGSGAELADLAMDRQAAGNRISNASLQTQAMLQERALNALMSGSNLASGMRGSSFNEAAQRGSASDQFAMLNQQAKNNIGAANKQFMQQAWGDMINRRNAWDANVFNQQLGTAGNVMGSDIAQNNAGYSYGGGQASRDADRKTDAQGTFNQNFVNPGTNGTAAYQNMMGEARDARQQAVNSSGGALDQYAQSIASMGAGMGGGFGGGAAAGPAAGGQAGAVFSEGDVFGPSGTDPKSKYNMSGAGW